MSDHPDLAGPRSPPKHLTDLHWPGTPRPAALLGAALGWLILSAVGSVVMAVVILRALAVAGWFPAGLSGRTVGLLALPL